MTLDPATPGGQRALERLSGDRVGWLTTVTPTGQPQSMPIWFLWVDGELVFYGDHRARRNANLATNPRVSFHLRTDPEADEYLVIEGMARVDPDYPAIPENPAFLAKYGPSIDRTLGGPVVMSQTYSLPVRITPARFVGIPR